jgi:hypothetical protein
MRLINALTLKLEEFNDPVEKPYAILSHRWEGNEVTFQDMQNLAIAREKSASFSKIEATCRIARDMGLHHVWVDTCCIDKSSSAELSEAINSMFRWYKNALYCFAFLSDVLAGSESREESDVGKSRWFTRGWTLQELIAPTNVLFYDASWNFLESKQLIARNIQRITGIDYGVLIGDTPLTAIPLAQRMSWAASRETTRVEDMAYCLLGIFDVNMPMLYGEGSRAFARLQEEILKKTTDLSLFAWQAKKESEYRGILAESPAEFIRCGRIELNYDQFSFRDEISITNKGVKISTRLKHVSDDIFVMDLHCYKENPNGALTRTGIYLKRVLDTYFRHWPETGATAEVIPGTLPLPIYLAFHPDKDSISSMIRTNESQRIFISFPKDTDPYRVHSIMAVPKTYWNADQRYFSIQNLHHFTCFVRFCVTSTVLPRGAYAMATEESTSFILVSKLDLSSRLLVTLYAQTGLQSSLKPEGFIDPFANIEQYGALGDPFSLSVLSPGESSDQQDRRVMMTHRDHRHDYEVSASLDKTWAPFQITVGVNPPGQYQKDPQWALLYGPGKPPNFPPPPPGPPQGDLDDFKRMALSVAPYPNEQPRRPNY